MLNNATKAATQALAEYEAKYSDDQARDNHGRWTAGDITGTSIDGADSNAIRKLSVTVNGRKTPTDIEIHPVDGGKFVAKRNGVTLTEPKILIGTHLSDQLIGKRVSHGGEIAGHIAGDRVPTSLLGSTGENIRRAFSAPVQRMNPEPTTPASTAGGRGPFQPFNRPSPPLTPTPTATPLNLTANPETRKIAQVHVGEGGIFNNHHLGVTLEGDTHQRLLPHVIQRIGTGWSIKHGGESLKGGFRTAQDAANHVAKSLVGKQYTETNNHDAINAAIRNTPYSENAFVPTNPPPAPRPPIQPAAPTLVTPATPTSQPSSGEIRTVYTTHANPSAGNRRRVIVRQVGNFRNIDSGLAIAPAPRGGRFQIINSNTGAPVSDPMTLRDATQHVQNVLNGRPGNATPEEHGAAVRAARPNMGHIGGHPRVVPINHPSVGTTPGPRNVVPTPPGVAEYPDSRTPEQKQADIQFLGKFRSVTGLSESEVRQKTGGKYGVADMVRLTGAGAAPEGATVEISNGYSPGSIDAAVRSPKFTCNRTYHMGDNPPHIYNAYFKASKDYQKDGLGINIFSAQVEHASSVGFGRIEVSAAGSPGDREYNGYYTWPRFGYDSVCTSRDHDTVKQYLPALRQRLITEQNLRPVPDEPLQPTGRLRKPNGTVVRDPDMKMSDIMKDKAGQDFWRAHGRGGHHTFDLTPGSQCLAVMRAYKIASDRARASGKALDDEFFNTVEHKAADAQARDKQGRFASGGESAPRETYAQSVHSSAMASMAAKKKLTTDEVNSVTTHTKNGFAVSNAHTQGEKVPMFAMKKKASQAHDANVDSALAKNPLPAKKAFYKTAPASEAANVKVGDKGTLPGYLHVSAHHRGADFLPGGSSNHEVTYVVHAPKGTPALPVTEMGGKLRSASYVLPKNTTAKVTKIEEANGRKTIHYRIIPTPPVAPEGGYHVGKQGVAALQQSIAARQHENVGWEDVKSANNELRELVADWRNYQTKADSAENN